MKINTKKGFTLIELLVVIAVIGILAAAIMPNLLSVKNKAQESNFVSYVKAVTAPIQVCCDQTTATGAATINGVGKGDICSAKINEDWNTKFFATVTGDCTKVTVTAAAGYGDCTGATITPSTGAVTFTSTTGTVCGTSNN